MAKLAIAPELADVVETNLRRSATARYPRCTAIAKKAKAQLRALTQLAAWAQQTSCGCFPRPEGATTLHDDDCELSRILAKLGLRGADEDEYEGRCRMSGAAIAAGTCDSRCDDCAEAPRG